MRRATPFAAAVALLALAAGHARADPAVPVPDGYRMDDYRAAVPDSVPGAEILHLPELRGAMARNGAVLIDVLPAPRRPDAMQPGHPWLPLPHRSLPGSLWWPETGRGALPPGAEARLRGRLQEVTASDPHRLVVFFCLNDCWMSWNAAKRAATMGFQAGWYPEGVDGWTAAGLPLAEVKPDALE